MFSRIRKIYSSSAEETRSDKTRDQAIICPCDFVIKKNEELLKVHVAITEKIDQYRRDKDFPLDFISSIQDSLDQIEKQMQYNSKFSIWYWKLPLKNKSPEKLYEHYLSLKSL